MALLEGLLHLLEVGQQAHIVGKLAGSLRDAGEGGGHLIVHLAGVGLAGHRHHPCEAHGGGDILLHGADLAAVPGKQLHEAGLGARGALAAQQCQAVDAVLHLQIVHIQFVQPQGGALAHGGQLRRLQVGVGQGGHGLVPVGKVRQ